MPSIAEIVTGVHYLVGAQAVISMDARTSQIVNNFYPTARDEVLAAAEWNFAIARSQLSQLQDTPAFEFAYQYSLPTDPYCLRAIEVYDTESVWKVEGRKLLIDDDEVYLRFIS